ncbi:hypothetical protein D3C81_1637270 [compost metagenome]
MGGLDLGPTTVAITGVHAAIVELVGERVCLVEDLGGRERRGVTLDLDLLTWNLELKEFFVTDVVVQHRPFDTVGFQWHQGRWTTVVVDDLESAMRQHSNLDRVL